MTKHGRMALIALGSAQGQVLEEMTDALKAQALPSDMVQFVETHRVLKEAIEQIVAMEQRWEQEAAGEPAN